MINVENLFKTYDWDKKPEELNVNEILKDYKNVHIVDAPQIEYNDKKILLVSRKFTNLETFLKWLQYFALIFIWKIIKIENSESIVVRCAIPDIGG